MSHHEALAVANEFIRRAQIDSIADVSQMKLQKLVYLAHGFYLANYEKPLIVEPVQAWKFGPVVPTLYRELREFGSTSISHQVSRSEQGFWDEEVLAPSVPSADTLDHAIIDGVWENYKHLSAVELSQITHEPDTPWSRVTENGQHQPSNMTIKNDIIQECFQGYLR